MRLYFEDPDGDRLALDTTRREWAATYEANTNISDDHFIINVEAPETLKRIEQEADFCGFGYNSDIENGRPPQVSVYTDYLSTLASYSAAADAGQLYEGRAEFYGVIDKIEKAKAAGYFNARQYAALILIIDDIKEALDLYDRAESN